MKRNLRIIVVLPALVMCVIPMWAEEGGGPPEMLAKVYTVDLMPGHQMEFESAMKEHMEMHRQAQDPWTRHAWVVVAGENVGRYYLRSAWHSWAGLDDEVEVPNDQEHVATAISPHIEAMSTQVSQMMPKLSNWPVDPGVPEMVEVNVFNLKYDGVEDFFHVVKKIHAMIQEQEMPLHYSWSEIVVGGSGPQFFLAMPRSGWADFKPPEPGIWAKAAEVYGETEAKMMRAMIAGAIESEEHFVAMFRPDLSYIP